MHDRAHKLKKKNCKLKKKTEHRGPTGPRRTTGAQPKRNKIPFFLKKHLSTEEEEGFNARQAPSKRCEMQRRRPYHISCANLVQQ